MISVIEFKKRVDEVVIVFSKTALQFHYSRQFINEKCELDART
jgi:hypothetical protein